MSVGRPESARSVRMARFAALGVAWTAPARMKKRWPTLLRRGKDSYGETGNDAVAWLVRRSVVAVGTSVVRAIFLAVPRVSILQRWRHEAWNLTSPLKT